MKKWYRNFLIIMVIIPFIKDIVTVYFVVTNTHLKPQISKEECNILKEYCNQLAKGELDNEELEEKGVEVKKISISSDEKSLRIELANNNCQVAAIFLLSNSKIKLEDGVLCQKKNILFENVMYFEKALPDSQIGIIEKQILINLIWFLILCIVCIAIPKEYKEYQEN